MAHKPKVTIDKMSVTVTDKGARLCLEGNVPRALWPRLQDATQPGYHLPALRRVLEVFPQLIPAQVLRADTQS